MNPAKILRGRIGAIKQVVLDEWPYKYRVRAIPEIRAKYRPLIETLDPLPHFQENHYEIHMLCGHRDVDMGIWASWSIMRFLEGYARLYVHSDGTLTEQDESIWRKVIGEIIVVDRKESDEKVKAALSAITSYLYEWRCGNWASAQLVDVHFFGDAPTMLLMDSDVLTFSRPDEVIAALNSPTPRFAWCRDLRNAYSIDPAVLKEATGVRVPERLCAGFLVSPRLQISDFLKLDRHLESIGGDQSSQINHPWSCQTYYALIAAGRSGSGTFSDNYSNSMRRTSPQQVLRHYVGIPRVRFRYFSEGIPRIIAGSRGKQA